MDQINAELAAEFDRITKNHAELKADLTKVIIDALKSAKYARGPVTWAGTTLGLKGLSVEQVDGAIMVEWTDDGERSECFQIEIGVA